MKNTIDIKKVISSPTTGFEAVDQLVKVEQKLLTAIHIMQSILINTDEDDWEYHKKTMIKFLSQFERS